MRASLEDKRLLLAEAGLVVTLGMVYLAFERRTAPVSATLLTGTTLVVDCDDILALPMETPPPPPSAPELPRLSDEIEVVEDDFLVDVDFANLTEEDGSIVPVGVYIPQEVVEEEETYDELPYVVVEQKPTFQGGEANAFSKWVNSHLVYPEVAKEIGVQGRVILQFTVDTDGRVINVKVLRGADETLDREAVRVVSSSPKWVPGRQHDRAVRVSYTFPVIFQLR
ncbi:MAG: energy transducer TonB [Bacteroidales bacterium]|nr:energy transducer TonB [Bacteroidales bacterium]